MQNQFISASSFHAMRITASVAMGWFAASLIDIQSADAATLTNKDSAAYKVDVIILGNRKQHQLAPGKSIAGFCKDGCIIRLNESEANDYELEGTERVSIEGGLVYYDGEEIIRKANDAPQATQPTK